MGFLVERRLRQVGRQLANLREELRILDEQRAPMTDDADDWEIRSLVADGDGGAAAGEAKLARRHADAQQRRRLEVVDEIARCESRQDELLDLLTK